MYVVISKQLKSPRFIGEIFKEVKEEEKEMGLSTDALNSIVRKEVALQIVNKNTFTAYDITKAIRLYMTNTDIPHGDVREMVHEMFDDKNDILALNGYNATICQSKRVGTVTVFHTDEADPGNYVALVIDTFVMPQPQTNSQDVSVDPDLLDAYEDLYNAALDVVDADVLTLSDKLRGLEESVHNLSNLV